MRIAVLAWQGSLHTVRWSEFYVEAGHEVHVVTCGGSELEGGYAVHDLGRPPFGKIGYVWRARAARRVLRSLAPDIVHAHFATSYGLLAIAAGLRPLVVTGHGSDILLAKRNWAKRLIVSRVLRTADLVTVPSEQMREAVVDLAGGDIPVLVLQYGVEVDRLTAVADRARSVSARGHRGPWRIVTARPLAPLYNVDVLLNALALLVKRGVDVACDVYDDGPERPRLEATAGALELGARVTFHGTRPPEEVECALAEADLYVSLASSDGASIALLEAMALGSVPVVSDIPANRAWLEDGVNGVLTPIDPTAVADAVQRALELEASGVRAANRRVVAARGDARRNLPLLDERLRSLVETASHR